MSSDVGFHGVYCLDNINPKWKGHSYVGFTVNPSRRIRQHNGELPNGAMQTKRKRPWDMIFCIFGFPSKIMALQFEWTCQNPEKAKPLREVFTKRVTQTRHTIVNNYCIFTHLLSSPPYNGLELTIQVFNENRFLEVKALAERDPSLRCRPLPRSPTFGDFASINKYVSGYGSPDKSFLSGQCNLCTLCEGRLLSIVSTVHCPGACGGIFHPPCLAAFFSSFAEDVDNVPLIPTNTVSCPSCTVDITWPLIIKYSLESNRRNAFHSKKNEKKRVADIRKKLRLEEKHQQQQSSQAADVKRLKQEEEEEEDEDEIIDEKQYEDDDTLLSNIHSQYCT